MKFWIYNRRALFYGLIIASGFMVVQQVAAEKNFQLFLMVSGLLALILLLEIYVTYISAAKVLKQLDLPTVEIQGRTAKVTYHLVLPILALVAMSGFIYTNNQLSLSLLYFVTSLGLFTMLFINIRAYYQDKFKLEEKTHVVYDLIKMLLYFTSVSTLLNIAGRYDFNYFVVAGLIFSTASLLTILIFLRYQQLDYINLAMILVAGLMIGYLTASLVEFLDERRLLTAFYSTLAFYITNAVLHHEFERTLKLSIVIEYLLVAGICFAIILLLP